MTNGEVQNTDNSLGNYYAFHRASVIINYNKNNNEDGNNTIQNREIGRVFTEEYPQLFIPKR
jgi:hypothetical protein